MRQHRGVYVAAVLTIIQAWRRAGAPRTEAENIVTYDGTVVGTIVDIDCCGWGIIRSQ